MPQDLLLRPLEPGDSLAEMTQLLHRAYARLLALGFRYAATAQDEAMTRKRIAGGECWVGVHAGRLVATITLRPPGTAAGSPWYEQGSLLLELVERRAASLGAGELALDTAEGAGHLVAYYAKRGYRFIERVRWPAANYTSVVLSKALPGREPARQDRSGRP